MKEIITSMLIAGFSIGVLFSAGCTQMPTEKQAIVDLRPQISFKADENSYGAKVLLDGLDMGSVGDYLDAKNSLRILPGTHILRVVLASQVLLEEKFYLGDGVNRTFIVK